MRQLFVLLVLSLLVPVMSWIHPQFTSVYNNCENTPSTPLHSCAAFVVKMKKADCQEIFRSGGYFPFYTLVINMDHLWWEKILEMFLHAQQE